MKGTINIMQYAGIPVRVHWSFGLIFLWVFYLGKSWNMDWEGMLWITSLIIFLFICVILHEFGHALTAKYFGVETKDIILSPVGGVARLESLPKKPIQELYIALAGPLVNIGIAIFLSLFIFTPSNWTFATLVKLGPEVNPSLIFIPSLIVLNLGLAVFNLIPAFPLDGGRVFRALLAIKMGKLKATNIATNLAQFFGLILFIWAVFTGSFFTIFISIFLFFAARQEKHYVYIQDVLTRYQVKDIYRANFKKIFAQDHMQVPITTLQKGVEKSFLVFDLDEKIIGVLHEDFILEALKEKAFDSFALDYLSLKFEYIHKEDSLKDILEKIETKGYSILPILAEEQLVGVLDRNSLYSFIRMQEKLK